MADTNDLLNQLLQKMTELVGSGGSGGGSSTIGGVAPGNNQKAVADLRSEVEKLTKEIKKNISPTFANITKSLIDSNNKLESATQQIKEFDSASKNASDAFSSATYSINRETLSVAEAYRTAAGETAGFIGKFGKIITTGGIKAMGDLTKSLQSGADSVEIGTALLSTTVSAASSTIGAAGQAATGLGGALMTVGNSRAKIAGGALMALGTAAGFTSDKFGKLAQFGIDVLSKELDKTVKAFGTLNSAGAVFADGVTGMRNAAYDSNLTLDQFSRVVDRNSELIAQSGLGMTEGAKQIGRVGKTIQQSQLGTQLLNLGYTFEEQAGLTAQTIADMRRSVGGTVSDTMVAEQTAKYAENLRIIAGITGEDAKRKVEEARAANTELAFQQKLAQLDPKQRQEINTAMAAMSKAEQQNLRERAVFGTVINREGAVLEATISGVRQKGEILAQMLEQNQLTTENVAKISGQFSETINSQILNAKGIAIAGMAGGDISKAVASSMTEILNMTVAVTKEAVDSTIAGIKDGKNTTDEMTKDLIKSQQAAQQMAIDLQKMLEVPLKHYVTITTLLTTEAEKMVRSFKEQVEKLSGDSGAAKKDTSREVATTAVEIAGGLAAGAAGTKIGAAIGTAILPGLGTLIGGALGLAVGGYVGDKAMSAVSDTVVDSISGFLSGIPGKAVGGIARGPTTGYLEKLHGEEAVIPTVGGRVPVEVSANVIDPSELTNIISDIKNSMISSFDMSPWTDALVHITQAFTTSNQNKSIDTEPISDTLIDALPSMLNTDLSLDITPISDMLSGMLPSAISEIATLVKSDNTTIQTIKQLADTIKNLQDSATLSNETQESTIAQLNTSINKLVTSSTTATETQTILFEKMISLIEELVEGDSESRRLLDDQLSTYRQVLRSVS